MREVQRIKDRIYSDYDAEIERAVKDDNIYDAIVAGKNVQVAFELGAMYMLRQFSYETNTHHKQGATETDKEYIARLERDLTEYSCSNAGWRHAFTGK